jgi:hypothetical protein
MKTAMLLALGLALAHPAHTPVFAQMHDTVILGTATPSGGFPVFGTAFVETINRADASLRI